MTIHSLALVAEARARCVRDPQTGCLLWQGPTKQGRPVLENRTGGNRTSVRVLMYAAAHPGEHHPRALGACPIGGALCVEPSHLTRQLQNVRTGIDVGPAVAKVEQRVVSEVVRVAVVEPAGPRFPILGERLRQRWEARGDA